MAQRKRKPTRPADRVASGIIYVLLAGIALLVYLNGRSDETGLVTGADSSAVAVNLLPGEVAELNLSDTRQYTAENLYEYINGQAPHYIGFGFRTLTVAEYSAGEDTVPKLAVDLYDMARRRNAYGLFMGSVPPEDEVIGLGNAGYASGNVASFWKGAFYVKVSGLTGDDMSSEVQAAAQSIASRIPDDSSSLAEFRAFPEDGLIPESLAYSKSAAFGLPYLEETFLGEYDTSEGYYRLFFCDLETPEAALGTLKEHAAFLKSGGGLLAEEYRSDGGRVWGSDKYVGPTLLIAEKGIVAGSTGLSDLAAAEPKVTALLEHSSEITSEISSEVSHGGK